MKRPLFWDKSGTIYALFLKPLGFLYAYTIRRRFEKSVPYQPKIPVICVGNISVGGTGKTPVCLAIAEWYQRHGYRVVFLNHGYKSKLQNVVVDTSRYDSQMLSDEALLLAQKAPTIIDRNRGRGVATAEKMGADLVIMDDGFQNPTVIKTLSLLVFDGRKGIGNGCCLPAGPLRETLEQGLKRADAVVIVGQDETGLEKKIQEQFSDTVILKGQLVPFCLKNHSIKRAIAFAGIGCPDKFFDMLRHYNIELEKTYSFSDHHHYSLSDLQEILLYKGTILTTPKDAIKLPKEVLDRVTVIEAPFIFEKEEEWDIFLKKGIQ